MIHLLIFALNFIRVVSVLSVKQFLSERWIMRYINEFVNQCSLTQTKVLKKYISLILILYFDRLRFIIDKAKLKHKCILWYYMSKLITHLFQFMLILYRIQISIFRLNISTHQFNYTSIISTLNQLPIAQTCEMVLYSQVAYQCEYALPQHRCN